MPGSKNTFKLDWVIRNLHIFGFMETYQGTSEVTLMATFLPLFRLSSSRMEGLREKAEHTPSSLFLLHFRMQLTLYNLVSANHKEA